MDGPSLTQIVLAGIGGPLVAAVALAGVGLVVVRPVDRRAGFAATAAAALMIAGPALSITLSLVTSGMLARDEITIDAWMGIGVARGCISEALRVGLVGLLLYAAVRLSRAIRRAEAEGAAG